VAVGVGDGAPETLTHWENSEVSASAVEIGVAAGLIRTFSINTVWSPLTTPANFRVCMPMMVVNGAVERSA